MSTAVVQQRLPDLDDPWQRLPWIIPLALFLWASTLVGFSFLMKEAPARQIEFKPIEARIVELPPDIGGLQGSGGNAAATPAVPKPPPPVPIVKPKPKPVAKLVPKKALVPPREFSPNGTAKSPEESEQEAPPASAPAAPARPGEGAGGSSGSGGEGSGGGGGGIGRSTTGARATFAPKPTIPDELREEVFETEAVASFRVSYDGSAEVELTHPTSNPRLNQIILAILKQWRFSPAVKNGVTINSVFELRIPVKVE